MGDSPAHLKKAALNEELARKLADEEPSKYADWVITTAFYAAIHCVEAYLFSTPEKHTDGSCPLDGESAMSTHDWREQLVDKYKPTASEAYSFLRQSAYVARYLCNSVFTGVGAADGIKYMELVKKECGY